MTKQQAQSEIAAAETKFKQLQQETSALEQRLWHEATDEEKRAVALIKKRHERRYSRKIKQMRGIRDLAMNKITALKVKHAAVLCELPIDSVMVEWIHDWQWKPTGRGGTLEVYLHGAEWPEGDYHKPDIGTVIVRVIGKNGRPTKQACRLSRESRDQSFRKYVWLPEGRKPQGA